MGTVTGLLRSFAAWTLMGLMPLATWQLARDTASHASAINWSAWAPDQVMVVAVGILGALLGAHLTLASCALIAARVLHLPRQWFTTFVPSGWRKVAATALGVSLATGTAAPALASEAEAEVTAAGWTPTPYSAVIDTQGGVSSLPPDQAPVPTGHVSHAGWDIAHNSTLETDHTTEEASATEVAAGEGHYTVQPGDSLWRITAQLLGDDASDADISRAWPELYRANKELIGSNPSLVHPGHVLTIPQGVFS